MIILCGWCKKFMGEKDGPAEVQHEDQDGNALVGLGMAIILSLPIWVAIFRLIARCVR